MVVKRLERLRDFFKGLSLSGAVITDMKNVRYFSGFTGSDGVLVVGEDRGFFLTDGRYTTQAAEEVKGFPVEEYKKKVDGIVSAISDLSLTEVGVESHNMTMFLYESLKEVPLGRGSRSITAIKDDLSKLRTVKEEGEIENIIGAIKISENALNGIIPMIAPGVSEADITAELEYAMRKGGSGPMPFPTIVASGENAAVVHAQPGGRKLEKGDLLIIDFGAEFMGYASDQTVTFAVGEGDEKVREVFEVVRTAQGEGIKRARPGVSTVELDKAVRDYIDDKGYGKYFTHGTGHGVGLNVHEPPTLSPQGDGVLSPGMVVTVEPGIYIPGWGGVRLEDMVLVTEDAPKVLTTLEKSFKVLS